MGFSTEALLALLIVALYLKDSLRLLRPDEAMLVRGLGGRWHAGFGARGYKLAGKEPWLANPLTPHAPAFRLAWAMQAGGGAGAGAGAHAHAGAQVDANATRPDVGSTASATTGSTAAAPSLSQLAGLAPCAWVSWALLFVVIPAAVLAQWGVVATLAALALLYVNILTGLALTWRRRAHFGLGGRAFALLAFECLACAPYSANLVRRVAAARPWAEDFTAAAARLLPAPALAEVHRECLARIDEQLEAEAEGSAAAAALQRARARFVAAGENP